MIFISKNKIGTGYTQLLAIHKKGGCYDDTKDDKSKGTFIRTNILKNLLKEQNNLCAYCMSCIDENSASIEHIVGQSYIDKKEIAIGKQIDTDYNNMLAVCNGQFCQEGLHCDKSRAKYQAKQPLLFISPLKNGQMNNITFSRNGEVKYNLSDTDIEYDINIVLNLNCKTLVENRKRVKDATLSSLIKNKFNIKYANKQLDYWIKNNENYKYVAIEELRKHT